MNVNTDIQKCYLGAKTEQQDPLLPEITATKDKPCEAMVCKTLDMSQ